MATAQEQAIAKAKADYNAAKAKGDTAGMAAAHAAADKARGYTTTADGSRPASAPSGSGGGSSSGSSGGGGSSNKTPVVIYNPDGTTSAGYISNGQTYYNGGARLGNGATVQAANGKYYMMTANGGVEVAGPQTSVLPKTVDLLNQTQVSQSPIMTADQLAKMYGVTYDFHTINNMLQDAALAKYNTAKSEALQTEGQFYDQAYGLQNDLLNTMRKGQGSVNLGASKGTFDANQLLAMLGWQQQTGDLATTLTQDRQQLGNVYAQDKALATQTALETANKAGVDLANLATMFNANDTQFGVGAMDALARIFQSKTDQSIANTQAAAAAASPGYSGGGGKYTYDNNANDPTYDSVAAMANANDFGSFMLAASATGMGYDDILSAWAEMGKLTPAQKTKMVQEGNAQLARIRAAQASGSAGQGSKLTGQEIKALINQFRH